FAQRIRDFGAQFSSFGIVAHSQGGAASLHLYTYYWSGLDYSTGSRMIQSVGTPYQGTPLAGNLAALGDVFGVGCGTNSNLTTSGASSWLSGIPTWARNEVHYYTTSFETKWWRYDYCSMGTDVFLSDPEDGVIEKSRGQLSGGNNKGHKTGWCHSSDMRDPAQTADSSRNSTMSSYAKR
ncbi:MAG TPA: conditioned medium factor, partial [Gammaproteobacteria bacterium]|nr:conditioned medium factor [Gammaproteobacteria bacterium]